ncbi:MAG: MFS transporter [Pseudomonadota bacterium]
MTARTSEDESARQLRRAERRYDIAVHRHLTRNFTIHLIHGLFGQTGFRLLNAPTFLPAFVLMLSGGSDFAVGVAASIQSFGLAVTPLIAANLIQHRTRVLPTGFLTGALMRLSVLAIALCGLFLNGTAALLGIYVGLFFFGMFAGMQGVIFNFLMSKVIPVSKRGRLTGLRNFLAGVTAAGVALLGGNLLLGSEPTAAGYGGIFLVAFVLTSIGLLSLLWMREPEPPIVRDRQSLTETFRSLPALLRDDPAFSRYSLARALATSGRMAMPFYIVYADAQGSLSGGEIGLLTIGFTLAGTFSNLFWGALADRSGFRRVFLLSIGLWIGATLMLGFVTGIAGMLLVFIGVGAATQGFQHSGLNLTLEFGRREDLPQRIAIANSTSEFSGALAPLAGGLLATAFGYGTMFTVAMALLLVGGLLVLLFVPEPRNAALSVPQ